MGYRFRTARTRRLAADERGFVVPITLLIVLAVLAVAMVAIFASLEAQSGSVRDQGTKSGLAAAEAGVSQALLAYNGGFTTTGTSTCLVPGSGGSVVAQAPASTGSSAGWCTTVTGSGGNGTYSYQVCPNWSQTTSTCLFNPATSTGTAAIVSTGSIAINGGGSSTVQRRVEVLAKSASGQPLFGQAALQSETDITLGSATQIYASSWANGSMSQGPSSTTCGAVTVGPRGTFTGGTWFPSYDPSTGCQNGTRTIGHDSLILPPVNQGDAATNNDNGRLTNLVNGTSPADSVTCNAGTGSNCVQKGDISWSASTRQLSLNGQKTALTLTGQTYSFCKLSMTQNSSLYIAPGITTRIYFDSPEACGLPPYNASDTSTAQLYMESNTRISASSSPAPSNVAIFFVGSQSIPTGAVFASNTDSNATCVQNFIVYGPLTQFQFNSNTSYCGAIAGYSINMSGNNTFRTDSASQTFTLPGTSPHYATSRFVDCSTTPPTGSAPSAGC